MLEVRAEQEGRPEAEGVSNANVSENSHVFVDGAAAAGDLTPKTWQGASSHASAGGATAHDQVLAHERSRPLTYLRSSRLRG
eukprot:scaffold184_cov379-Prasinococcus_capsulatus_cf.AAC.6